MNSSIKALSSTEAQGVGFTASIINCDEWDLHPYASENYAIIQPCIDSSGGQFIGVFTRNPWGSEDSLASSTFKNALEGKNGFKPIFTPYTARPGRDEEWYQRTRNSLTEQELKGLTRELYMKKNYPCSVQEAFSVIGVLQAFDNQVLDRMASDLRSPVNKGDNALVIDNIDNKIVNIFRPYQMGHFYVSAIDASHGVGKDYSVCTIMDVKTCEIVADIIDKNLKPEIFSWHCYQLLKSYKFPKCYPEDNDWGAVVINTLLDMGYRNMGYQDDKNKKPGWHTGKNRTEMLGSLCAAINNNQITIYNKDGLRQFYDVIKTEEGRIEARGGGNDDYPMAVGICWAKKESVPIVEWEPKVIQTLHF